MFGKIWERYFIKQTVKVFVLILVCFYGLYFLIDYTSRSGSQFSFHSQFKLFELLHYYFHEFIQRLDVLVPFALLIATIRTLTQLNTQNELVALLASGTKMKTLLRPFILIGLTCVGAVYFNSQFLIPHALKEMRHTQDIHSLKKKKKKQNIFVQSVALKDNSVLLFQDYDSATEKFFDSYWIKSFNEVYHIKYLSPKPKIPLGTYVDHLVRNSSGSIEKVNSFESKAFPDMHFNRKVLLDTITPPEELSLSKLWSRLPPKGKSSSEKEAHLTTTFYQKLAMPWLSLLAVLGPAPLCVRFSRYFPVFYIYALSIFGLAAFYIIINASVILGSRQLLPPFLAIAPPFFLFMGVALLRFIRLK